MQLGERDDPGDQPLRAGQKQIGSAGHVAVLQRYLFQFTDFGDTISIWAH